MTMKSERSTGLPSVSTTFTWPSTTLIALLRATSLDHRRQLVVLLQHLDELLRLHAVLLRALHEVLRELVLRDADALLLGDGVEEQLRPEGLLARLGDLGAVHVVLEPALGLEVAVHLVVDELLRDGHVHLGEQGVGDLVAGLR